MPTLVCRNCGTTIRVQGVAALCPKCGFLVQVGEAAETKPSKKSAPKQETVEHDPLLDVLSQHAPVEEQQPDWLIARNERVRQKQMMMIGGGVAAVLAAVVIMVIIGSRPSAPPAPVVVVAPKPVAPVPPPVIEEPPPAPVVAATEPASQPALVVVAPPPRPHAELKKLLPKPAAGAVPLTDERIGQAIQRGIDFLYGKFTNGSLPPALMDAESDQGLHALCVYALLHAGQATGDTRLAVRDEAIRAMLSKLKSFPMNGAKSTYSRSLRLAALGVYDRDEDRTAMEADAAYLLKSSMGGAYDYSQPPAGTKRGEAAWDNSNSQYGALGLWIASEAGVPVPMAYWNDVENHWLDVQSTDGGWGYRKGEGSTVSMTAAGLTMLFVGRSQTTPDAPMTDKAPVTLAIQRGLSWLGKGDTIRNLSDHWPGYTLYGIERVGLASGYKFIGEHDWYLELAADAIKKQNKDGSWTEGSGPYIETAFRLLLLSRGRHPVFMAKLQYDGKWNNRPRDVAQLTEFADKQLERRLNWQIVDLDRPWLDWTDSPILFISGDKLIELTDDHLEKLRSYVRAGGLIFTHTDRNQAPFNKFVEELVPKLWPGRSLTPLPDTHPIYSVFSPIQGKSPAPLSGVDNGARLLLVHSPTDFARLWQHKISSANRRPMELGMNVVLYASGKRDFANRANSPFIAKPSGPAIGTIPVARLSYNGSWDPEPGAWERFSRWFQVQTSIAVDVKPMEVNKLTFVGAPFAHLTGTGPVSLDDGSISTLRTFCDDGGTLLIDACGGSQSFRDSLHGELLTKLLGDTPLLPVEDNSLIVSGNLPGSELLVPPLVRGYVSETMGKKYPKLQLARIGRGAVVVSDLDITSGLLGTNTWSVLGYAPTYAESLLKNTLLWTIANQP